MSPAQIPDWLPKQLLLLLLLGVAQFVFQAIAAHLGLGPQGQQCEVKLRLQAVRQQ